MIKAGTILTFGGGGFDDRWTSDPYTVKHDFHFALVYKDFRTNFKPAWQDSIEQRRKMEESFAHMNGVRKSNLDPYDPTLPLNEPSNTDLIEHLEKAGWIEAIPNVQHIDLGQYSLEPTFPSDEVHQ